MSEKFQRTTIKQFIFFIIVVIISIIASNKIVILLLQWINYDFGTTYNFIIKYISIFFLSINFFIFIYMIKDLFVKEEI